MLLGALYVRSDMHHGGYSEQRETYQAGMNSRWGEILEWNQAVQWLAIVCKGKPEQGEWREGSI